jgi:hypothetical protein
VITSHTLVYSPEQLVEEFEEGVRDGATVIQVDIMPDVPDESIHALMRAAERHAKT